MIERKAKNIEYVFDEKNSECIVTDKTNNKEILRTQNYIEGFNTFWQEAGAKVLNEIKDKLEAYGFNRWTGEKES